VIGQDEAEARRRFKAAWEAWSELHQRIAVAQESASTPAGSDDVKRSV
jgi:hypothetical protein